MKKSQAAMEFLMTYGWAILVVLIVIGAFVYFGVLKPRQMVPRMCTFSGFRCADHRLIQNGALEITFTNAYGRDVTYNTLNFTSETTGAVSCSAASDSAILVAMGDSATVSTYTCSFSEGIKPGTRVKGSAVFVFTEPVHNIQHKVIGTIVTDVEG